MVFQSRKGAKGQPNISSTSASRQRLTESNGQMTSQVDSDRPQSIDTLVDVITEAVRKKFIERGVPIPRSLREEVAQITQPPEAQSLNVDRIGQNGEIPLKAGDRLNEELAKMIDHTLLKPDATEEEIKRVCDEAKKYGFATVCINSQYVEMAARFLKGSQTKPIAVVGFPLGAAATATKSYEARMSIDAGAEEIDMVIAIGALKSKDYAFVLNDIKEVVKASSPKPVKVILETSNLTTEEKIIGCALSKAAGAAFVKTSTGFGQGGATVEDVELMRRIVGPTMGVKASGGIRSFEDASKMIKAGATRIGASASIAIVTQTAESSPKKKTYKSSLY